MTAIFSPCRTWRYTLTREIATPVLDRKLTDLSVPEGEVGRVIAQVHFERGGRGTVAFVGLNPSTADETTDDPTVRRCVGFARRWGYDRMVMLNVFAFRATNPRRLHEADDPVGELNDHYIVEEASAADLVVCAWGVHGAFRDRGAEVYRKLIVEANVGVPHALGLTKDGHPRHPLYLRGDLTPIPWEG